MDDNEIIRRILDGDSQIFRILVEKYQSTVFHTCMGFLHNKDDAEDLTQDVFMRVYTSLNSFRGKAAFSTWIYRIAINAALNQVRKNSQIPVHSRLDLTYESGMKTEIPLAAYDAVNPESIIIHKEYAKLVQDALDGLPENQRTAIILSKYDDLSQKEIAAILQTSEGAVEALIQRAKINLRVKLSYFYKKYRNIP